MKTKSFVNLIVAVLSARYIRAQFSSGVRGEVRLTRFIKWSPILLTIVLAVGCSTMYIPPSPMVPLLEKKNDGLVEAGVSSNSVFMSGAYAFSDKYALMIHGNMSFRNFSNMYDVLNRKGESMPAPNGPYEPFAPPFDFVYFFESSAFTHRYIEAGLGRYKLRPSSAGNLELIGGVGYGYAVENIFDGSGAYKNKYWLGFVQLNTGKKWRGLEYGFTMRAAYSGFYFSTPSVIDSRYPPYPYLGKVLNFNNIHFEPLGFFRGRLIKFNNSALFGFVKYGVSITLPVSDSFAGIYLPHGIERERLRYTIANFSLGVNYRF